MAELWRREFLALSPMAFAGFSGGSAKADAIPQATTASAPTPFRFSLNTSTIRGQNLGIVKEVELAADIGYDAIEPWIRELDEYVQAGGSLDDLGKRIADAGLTVESAIGFPEWAVDDEDRRRKGLDEAKRNMEMLHAIGGTRLAAPPVGLTDIDGVDLRKVAERYRALLEVGDDQGVVPQLEVWGFSKTLSRLGEAAFVVMEAAHPSACILADVYHLYKGGTDFGSLKYLDWGNTSRVFHMNDYPDIPRDAINDADRVFPGLGIAPMSLILAALRDSGFQGILSLELFNRSYWERDARAVAEEGLASMRQAVAQLPSASAS